MKRMPKIGWSDDLYVHLFFESSNDSFCIKNDKKIQQIAWRLNGILKKIERI